MNREQQILLELHEISCSTTTEKQFSDQVSKVLYRERLLLCDLAIQKRDAKANPVASTQEQSPTTWLCEPCSKWLSEPFWPHQPGMVCQSCDYPRTLGNQPNPAAAQAAEEL